MKIGNRHYNNLIKELKWWWKERFTTPEESYRNPCKVTYLGYLEPATKEAKKHMKEVDKTEGKPNTWEEDVAEGIKIVPALGKLLERLNKTKGRLKK